MRKLSSLQNPPHRLFNVTAPDPVDTPTLAEMIKRITGSSSELEVDHSRRVRQLQLNTARFEDLVTRIDPSFRFTSLEDGLKATVAWQRLPMGWSLHERTGEQAFKVAGRRVEGAVLVLDPRAVHVDLAVQEDLNGGQGIVRDQGEPSFIHPGTGRKGVGEKGIRQDFRTTHEMVRVYIGRHPDRRVIGYVGDGNLLMGKDVVAWVDGTLYHVQSEPVTQRPYFSLIFWNDGRASLDWVRFRDGRVIFVQTPESVEGQDVTHEVRALTSGERILERGSIIPRAEITEEFDLRHLIAFPFMGGDMNFGYVELVADPGLRQRALRGEVLAFPLPAQDQMSNLQAGLDEKSYQAVTSIEEVREPGQYVIDKASGTLSIRFKPGIYPHNIIGVRRDGTLVSLVIKGKSNRIGISFEEAAQLMREQGATDAIILDNGGDAMMNVGGRFVVPSFTGRDQLSALLVFTQPRPAQVTPEAPPAPPSPAREQSGPATDSEVSDTSAEGPTRGSASGKTGRIARMVARADGRGEVSERLVDAMNRSGPVEDEQSLEILGRQAVEEAEERLDHVSGVGRVDLDVDDRQEGGRVQGRIGEVLVQRDEDAFFVAGAGGNHRIGAGGFNADHVVTGTAQGGPEFEGDVLVNQEPHGPRARDVRGRGTPGSWRTGPQSAAQPGHDQASDQDSSPDRQSPQEPPRLPAAPRPHRAEFGSLESTASHGGSEDRRGHIVQSTGPFSSPPLTTSSEASIAAPVQAVNEASPEPTSGSTMFDAGQVARMVTLIILGGAAVAAADSGGPAGNLTVATLLTGFLGSWLVGTAWAVWGRLIKRRWVQPPPLPQRPDGPPSPTGEQGRHSDEVAALPDHPSFSGPAEEALPQGGARHATGRSVIDAGGDLGRPTKPQALVEQHLLLPQPDAEGLAQALGRMMDDDDLKQLTEVFAAMVTLVTKQPETQPAAVEVFQRVIEARLSKSLLKQLVWEISSRYPKRLNAAGRAVIRALIEDAVQPRRQPLPEDRPRAADERDHVDLRPLADLPAEWRTSQPGTGGNAWRRRHMLKTLSGPWGRLRAAWLPADKAARWPAEEWGIDIQSLTRKTLAGGGLAIEYYHPAGQRTPVLALRKIGKGQWDPQRRRLAMPAPEGLPPPRLAFDPAGPAVTIELPAQARPLLEAARWTYWEGTIRTGLTWRLIFASQVESDQRAAPSVSGIAGRPVIHAGDMGAADRRERSPAQMVDDYLAPQNLDARSATGLADDLGDLLAAGDTDGLAQAFVRMAQRIGSQPERHPEVSYAIAGALWLLFLRHSGDLPGWAAIEARMGILERQAIERLFPSRWWLLTNELRRHRVSRPIPLPRVAQALHWCLGVLGPRRLGQPPNAIESNLTESWLVAKALPMLQQFASIQDATDLPSYDPSTLQAEQFSRMAWVLYERVRARPDFQQMDGHAVVNEMQALLQQEYGLEPGGYPLPAHKPWMWPQSEDGDAHNAPGTEITGTPVIKAGDMGAADRRERTPAQMVDDSLAPENLDENSATGLAGDLGDLIAAGDTEGLAQAFIAMAHLIRGQPEAERVVIDTFQLLLQRHPPYPVPVLHQQDWWFPVQRRINLLRPQRETRVVPAARVGEALHMVLQLIIFEMGAGESPSAIERYLMSLDRPTEQLRQSRIFAGVLRYLREHQYSSDASGLPFYDPATLPIDRPGRIAWDLYRHVSARPDFGQMNGQDVVYAMMAELRRQYRLHTGGAPKLGDTWLRPADLVWALERLKPPGQRGRPRRRVLPLNAPGMSGMGAAGGRRTFRTDTDRALPTTWEEVTETRPAQQQRRFFLSSFAVGTLFQNLWLITGWFVLGGQPDAFGSFLSWATVAAIMVALLEGARSHRRFLDAHPRILVNLVNGSPITRAPTDAEWRELGNAADRYSAVYASALLLSTLMLSPARWVFGDSVWMVASVVGFSWMALGMGYAIATLWQRAENRQIRHLRELEVERGVFRTDLPPERPPAPPSPARDGQPDQVASTSSGSSIISHAEEALPLETLFEELSSGRIDSTEFLAGFETLYEATPDDRKDAFIAEALQRHGRPAASRGAPPEVGAVMEQFQAESSARRTLAELREQFTRAGFGERRRELIIAQMWLEPGYIGRPGTAVRPLLHLMADAIIALRLRAADHEALRALFELALDCEGDAERFRLLLRQAQDRKTLMALSGDAAEKGRPSLSQPPAEESHPAAALMPAFSVTVHEPPLNRQSDGKILVTMPEPRRRASRWDQAVLSAALDYAKAHHLTTVLLSPPFAQYRTWSTLSRSAPHPYVAYRHYSKLPYDAGFRLRVRRHTQFSRSFLNLGSHLVWELDLLAFASSAEPAFVSSDEETLPLMREWTAAAWREWLAEHQPALAQAALARLSPQDGALFPGPAVFEEILIRAMLRSQELSRTEAYRTGRRFVTLPALLEEAARDALPLPELGTRQLKAYADAALDLLNREIFPTAHGLWLPDLEARWDAAEQGGDPQAAQQVFDELFSAPGMSGVGAAERDGLGRPEGQQAAGDAAEVRVGRGEMSKAVGPKGGDVQGVVGQEMIPMADLLGSAELSGGNTDHAHPRFEQEVQPLVHGTQVAEDLGSAPHDLKHSGSPTDVAPSHRFSQQQPVPNLSHDDHRRDPADLSTLKTLEEGGTGGFSTEQVLEKNIRIHEDSAPGRELIQPRHQESGLGVEQRVVVNEDPGQPFGDAEQAAGATDRILGTDDQRDGSVFSKREPSLRPQDSLSVDRLSHHRRRHARTIASAPGPVKPAADDVPNAPGMSGMGNANASQQTIIEGLFNFSLPQERIAQDVADHLGRLIEADNDPALAEAFVAMAQLIRAGPEADAAATDALHQLLTQHASRFTAVSFRGFLEPLFAGTADQAKSRIQRLTADLLACQSCQTAAEALHPEAERDALLRSRLDRLHHLWQQAPSAPPQGAVPPPRAPPESLLFPPTRKRYLKGWRKQSWLEPSDDSCGRSPASSGPIVMNKP
ncbi:MAG: phosphodiester glycosidase family protein [Candidatus Omnitrophica bacterium]|nr:phosphodiester glycosidase family protein [Candidatus Omnitrophota bacterium]